MFPSAKGPCVFPHAVGLRIEDLAIDEEVVTVTGLLLVPSAPPKFIRRDHVDLVSGVVSRRRVLGKRAGRLACEGLSLVTEMLSKLPTALRGFVPATSIDVPCNLWRFPPIGPRGRACVNETFLSGHCATCVFRQLCPLFGPPRFLRCRSGWPS